MTAAPKVKTTRKRKPARSRHAHPAIRYQRDVLSGAEPVGELVYLAVERHVKDLEEGHKRGLYFSTDLAQHNLDFYLKCVHSKGEWAGKPFYPLDWQAWVDWVLFGWVWADTGYRRFNTGYVTVARKNGKSTWAAKDGLYLLGPDEEPGAEIYTAATKRDQAKIVHAEATRMVQASPALAAKINVWKDNLSIPGTAAKYEPLGADADTHDGLNPHGVIIDEIHAHKKRDQYDVLRTGMGARRQPLLLIITTAGASRTTIWYELDNRSAQVVRGVLTDDSWFAYIARPDEGDDWREEETHRKGNPSWSIINKRTFRQDLEEAKGNIASQNTFRRLRCNEMTQQVDRVIDMDKWVKLCGGPPEIPRGADVYCGLDLSSKIDLTAACLVHLDAEGVAHVKIHFWMPEEAVVKKTRRDRVPYDAWVREGYITATPGNVVDQNWIKRWIVEQEASGEVVIQTIAFDPWNATKLAQELQDEEGFVLAEVRQGYKSMSEPTKSLIGAVLDGAIRHGGHPVLTWMADNLAVRRDTNDNMMPMKGDEAAVNRIDGIIALIMALNRALLAAVDPSVYEKRDIRTLN